MQKPVTMWAFVLRGTWSEYMRLLLFLLLTSNLMLVYAQENSSTVEESEIQGKKPADDTGPENQVEIETPDTFESTEKLSEDIPAPFPVDI